MGASSTSVKWEPGTLLPSLRGRADIGPGGRPRKPPVVIRQREPTSAARFTYEHPDEGDDPLEDRFVLRDTTLAGRIAEEIERVYPWPQCLLFDVRIETEQGIIQIWLKGFQARQSYNCHVAAVETDPKCRQVLIGCGELLERYGLSREKLDRDATAAAKEKAVPIWLRSPNETPGGNYTKRF